MKLSWPQLSLEMEKLYSKEIDVKDVKMINNHCQTMVDFLHACGWTEEEYLQQYLYGDVN